MLLAVAFLVAYAWPILDTGLPPTTRELLESVSWAVWAAFLVDFLVRIALAEDRVKYALAHWYDFVLVALPLFRPLRLLRLLALVRILDRSLGSSFAGRVTVYVSGAAGLSMFLAALAVLDAERDAPGANITSIENALWWAATTVTTVGYGDHYPVTLEGRIVAFLLMIVGIGVVGTVTASIASWFMARASAERAGSGRR